jgi:hypothetical protein
MSEAHMTTVQECQEALEKLASRMGELSPSERADYFGNRTMSVTIPDLGVTFITRLGGDTAEPVREAGPGDPKADIRITADSDKVISLSESPMNIGRMWLSGQVKIDASVRDLFRLRKLL